ncbi:UNVERIFIED_CONTAM: hypothetical protein Slati_0963200 [Sesamum latifolium]|uniref:Reverse transcriptase zinc-binding domain-containing protein n=1 Tax=Sesamum latifolium TaxID=2727402 RepID=A0AAW2XWW5_9LAMI
MFTVRSAYHIACSLEDCPGSSTLGLSDHGWWRKVWQSKLPNKIKVFIWQVCLNALPTSVNLSKRVRDFSGGCLQCQCKEEDSIHFLFHCTYARQVWGLSHLSSVLSSCLVPDVCRWMQSVLSQLDDREFSSFLCLCWYLWWSRNCKLMEGACFKPWQVVSFAAHYLNSFLTQSCCSNSSSGPSAQVCWQAPPLGFIKLNFDGATFDRGNAMGVGVVARDVSGQCVAWLSRCLCWTGNGELAEAWAAREAVLLALRRGWRSVMVEGDCENLIRKLYARNRDLSPVGPIVTDVLHLSNHFQSCSFLLVKHSSNVVAHFFAKSAQGSVEGDSNIPPTAVHRVSLDILS